MDLEMILASSCRRRILKVLWMMGHANVMLLVRKVNSTYSQVNPHLLLLKQEGIIIDKRLGRMREIKLNRENPKTEILLQVLKIFEKSKTNKPTLD